MSTAKKKENPVRRKEPRRHELCSCGSGLKAKDCCQKPAKKEGWFSTTAGDELVGAYNETVCKTGEDKYNRIIRYVKDLRPPGRNKIQLYCGCGLYHSVEVQDKTYNLMCFTWGFKVSHKDWDAFLKEFMEKAMEYKEKNHVEP